jgi:protease-4
MMSDQNNWERAVLEKLALSALEEQRRARHWGIFFKTLTLGFMFIVLFISMGWIGKSEVALASGKHTALVNLEGVIASNSMASAESLIPSLQDAFEDKNTKGVILRINSPGGSPVQAGYVNDEIYRLKAKHPGIRVYAVITDMCASGGYYIASAADEIYADKASIVGSIGVIMNGFGFTGTMEKLGVERRLFTAGEDKGFLDPFSPLKPGEVQHVNNMLEDIHQQFINTVKKGRGDRLSNDPKLFSGLVWTGEEALNLGLIDSLGSSSYVARDIIKADKIVDYTHHEDYLDRFAKRFGATLFHMLDREPVLR